MDLFSILLFLLLGGGVLLVVVSLLLGAGTWMVQFLYAVYYALFAREDKNKGKKRDYSIKQGKEV